MVCSRTSPECFGATEKEEFCGVCFFCFRGPLLTWFTSVGPMYTLSLSRGPVCPRTEAQAASIAQAGRTYLKAYRRLNIIAMRSPCWEGKKNMFFQIWVPSNRELGLGPWQDQPAQLGDGAKVA